MTFKEFAREFSTGYLGHFIIGIAAVALLGGAAHYLGLSRWAIFALVVVVIFSASVLIPGPKKYEALTCNRTTEVLLHISASATKIGHCLPKQKAIDGA